MHAALLTQHVSYTRVEAGSNLPAAPAGLQLAAAAQQGCQ
jgi:hypothetical protein